MMSSAPIIDSAICIIMLIPALFMNNFVTPFFARMVKTPTNEMVVAMPNAMESILIIPITRILIEIENSSTITAPVQGIMPTATAKGMIPLVVTGLSSVLFPMRFSFFRKAMIVLKNKNRPITVIKP